MDRSLVLPVQHTLQGHPKLGRLWEEHINKILSDTFLNFKSTTHDKCIYQTTFEGHRVLILQQVDDFLILCKLESVATRIYNYIGKKLMVHEETVPPFKYLGIAKDYNGVDINQTKQYI